MAWTPKQIGAVLIAATLAPAVARSAPQTYRYAISSRQFGTIGTYVRSADSVDGLDQGAIETSRRRSHSGDSGPIANRPTKAKCGALAA